MLLGVSERMEQFRAVVLEVDVLKVSGLRRYSVKINEASIIANIEALDAIEGHFRDFKALNPDESFATADCQKNARLDCAGTCHSLKELEVLDGASVLWQIVSFQARSGAI